MTRHRGAWMIPRLANDNEDSVSIVMKGGYPPPQGGKSTTGARVNSPVCFAPYFALGPYTLPIP